jgi:ABC-type dipeptide/oligopeptide/nickel transport system permease subunit
MQECVQTRHVPIRNKVFKKASVLNKASIINYVVALLIILTMNFFIPRLMPGDPLQAIYGNEALLVMTPELQEELTHRFSLDRPLGEQYASYLLSLCRGDLGHSYYYNAPVLKVISGFLPWTLLLTGLALVISTLVGFFLGVESGSRRGRPLDQVLLGSIMLFSGLLFTETRVCRERLNNKSHVSQSLDKSLAVIRNTVYKVSLDASTAFQKINHEVLPDYCQV